MSNLRFYDEFRRKTDSLWQAIFNHPFVKGIGDGTLSRDRYEFFLKQDYLYLIHSARIFAIAAAKAPLLHNMSYFTTLLYTTLNREMELHRTTCLEFGIPLEVLEQTEMAMITCAYTNLLVRTAYEGTVTDIVAVILPCAAGYIEIGQRLKSEGLPDNRFYREWIAIYTSEDLKEVAERLKDEMNRQAHDAPKSLRDHWSYLYVLGTRFEFLFFDMSWKKELWPKALQI